MFSSHDPIDCNNNTLLNLSRSHVITRPLEGNVAISYSDYYSYFGTAFAYSRGGAVIRAIGEDKDIKTLKMLMRPNTSRSLYAS